MARTFPAKFIHFGLPKCGSTFLQSVWGEDEQYTGADLTQTAQVSRKLAAAGQKTSLPRMDFTVSARAGTTLIASSEGFSWAFLGRPHLLDRIRDLHQIGAAITAATRVTDTAVFMVRNPLDWIRAAHEQIIKDGGSMSGEAFLDCRRPLIECVLDLSHIQSVFGEHYRRVVFLSADEMRRDPETFWARYSDTLDAPRPGQSVLEKIASDQRFSNTSLKAKTAALARLNRIFGEVGDAWRAADGLSPDLRKERDVVQPKYDLARVWAARRTAETLSEEDLEAILGGAHREMSKSFTDLPLDEELRAYLREHFCDVVDGVDTIPDGLKAEYRAALG